MAWKQVGYGIIPFGRVKAPHIQSRDDGDGTMFIVRFPEKLTFKETEKFGEMLYQKGKDLMNPPKLNNTEATASNFNLDSLTLVNKELQDSFLRQFCGVAVRPDPLLSANGWYCAVSLEIFATLKKINK